MRHFLKASTSLALVTTLAKGAAAIPAFPGAEGFGAQATGGRGGKVLHVTHLRASGPGSLQYALDQTFPRTIVFDVSGVVEGVPILSHGNVTVAGQTSPSGIVLRGLMIQGEVVEEDDHAPLPRKVPRNFILQHLRLRSPQQGSDGDGLRLHHAQNGILDHLSIGNARDEAVQISFASDISLQHCILGETLGEHANLGGMLLNYGDPKRGFPLTRLSIHHNYFARIPGRLPEFSRESPANRGSTMDVEVSNNLYFDPRFPMMMSLTSQLNGQLGAARSDPVHYRANLIGNYFLQNPSRDQSFGMLSLEAGLSQAEGYVPPGSPTRLYLEDNRTNLAEAADWSLVYGCNDWLQALRNGELPFHQRRPFFAASQRLDFPPIRYHRSADLVEQLPRTVGAWPRDAMDHRLCDYALRRRFPQAEPSQNPAGDALKLLEPRSAPADSDRDGMPDTWEKARGLNPARDDSQGHQLHPSYTNLEHYLHQLRSTPL